MAGKGIEFHEKSDVKLNFTKRLMTTPSEAASACAIVQKVDNRSLGFG